MKKFVIFILSTMALGAGFGCGKSINTDLNQEVIITNEITGIDENINSVLVNENKNSSALFYLDLQEIDALSDDVNAASRNIDTQFEELENLDSSDDEIEI